MLRIYSLNSFPIYPTVVLAILVLLYIASLGVIYLLPGSLYVMTIFLQFPLPSPSTFGNQESGLFCYEYVFFRLQIYLRSYSICLSVPDLFHLIPLKSVHVVENVGFLDFYG